MCRVEKSTRARGDAVERRVATYLEAQGLRVLARNVTRAGAEVDLVLLDPRRAEPEHVFVEVRSRAHAQRGTPLETVNREKQRQVVRAATAWLVAEGLWERACVRFDVVGVTSDPADERIEWIENAFDA